jgi:hypothetical protein
MAVSRLQTMRWSWSSIALSACWDAIGWKPGSRRRRGLHPTALWTLTLLTPIVPIPGRLTPSPVPRVRGVEVFGRYANVPSSLLASK